MQESLEEQISNGLNVAKSILTELEQIASAIESKSLPAEDIAKKLRRNITLLTHGFDAFKEIQTDFVSRWMEADLAKLIDNATTGIHIETNPPADIEGDENPPN